MLVARSCVTDCAVNKYKDRFHIISPKPILLILVHNSLSVLAFSK